jgi:hypothetical protein
MTKTPAGKFRRRVTFQMRPLDENGDQQAWSTIITRAAAIVPLRGGEEVKQQRLTGSQPVAITVRRDSVTRQIDNSWRAFDARGSAPPAADATVWNITSVFWDQAHDTMEILAVQAGSGASG